MAIVKGILVNDGGAPARIMNFVAAEAISAGDAVSLQHLASGDAKVQKASSDDTNGGVGGVFFGVALTDAASAGECSVVLGRGVIVNCQVSEDLGGGIPLMLDADANAGKLVTFADGGSPVNTAPCAVTVEDNSAAGLTKVLIL